jgi:hypothetical protein
VPADPASASQGAGPLATCVPPTPAMPANREPSEEPSLRASHSDSVVEDYQAALARSAVLGELTQIPGVLAIIVDFWHGRLRPFYAYQWLELMDDRREWCRAQIVSRTCLRTCQDESFAVDEHMVHVTYPDWSDRWDEVLDLRRGSAACTRVAVCGTHLRWPVGRSVGTDTAAENHHRHSLPAGLSCFDGDNAVNTALLVAAPEDLVVYASRGGCETASIVRVERAGRGDVSRCLIWFCDRPSGRRSWVEAASQRVQFAGLRDDPAPCLLCGLSHPFPAVGRTRPPIEPNLLRDDPAPC